MRGEGVRWVLCAAVVAAAHGGAYFALTTTKANVESNAGSPIVTLELSPILAAPAPPPDEVNADAPAAPETAPATPVAEAPPPPPPAITDPPAKPPEPSPEPTPPAPPEPTSSQEAAIDPNPPPPASAATPEAVAPPPPATEMEAPRVVETPPPEKETPIAVQTQPPTPPPPPPSAPSAEAAATADIAAAPSLAPGREDSVSSAVVQSWQRELIAQIERHKRFPVGAAGQSGVARVAFSIDRSGRVTDVRIAASSGSATLDEAALDLIRRSQPFPEPPAALPEQNLSFVAPVRYLPPARRP